MKFINYTNCSRTWRLAGQHTHTRVMAASRLISISAWNKWVYHEQNDSLKIFKEMQFILFLSRRKDLKWASVCVCDGSVRYWNISSARYHTTIDHTHTERERPHRIRRSHINLSFIWQPDIDHRCSLFLYYLRFRGTRRRKNRVVHKIVV